MLNNELDFAFLYKRLRDKISIVLDNRALFILSFIFKHEFITIEELNQNLKLSYDSLKSQIAMLKKRDLIKEKDDSISLTDIGLIILKGAGIVNNDQFKSRGINIRRLIKNKLREKKVLLIDDDEDTLQVYTEVLVENGSTVQSFLRKSLDLEVEDTVFKREYDLLIFKFDLPDFDSVSDFKRIKKMHMNTPCLIMVSHWDIYSAMKDEISKDLDILTSFLELNEFRMWLKVLLDERDLSLGELFDKIKNLAILFDNKDMFAKDHAQHVTDEVRNNIKDKNLDEDEKKRIELVAFTHDFNRLGNVGKQLLKFVCNPDQWKSPEKIEKINNQVIPEFLLQLERATFCSQHFCERYSNNEYLEYGLNKEIINSIEKADRFDILTRKTRYREAFTEKAARNRIEKYHRNSEF